MDTATLLESWGTLGATGVISLMFAYMVGNLMKSQAAQNESLDKLSIDQAKAEETVENVEGILLKLLSRLDKSDERLDRKVDDIKRELSDIDNQLSEVRGNLARINGRN